MNAAVITKMARRCSPKEAPHNGAEIMDLHLTVYLGLAIVYLEAAIENFSDGRFHCAFRETIVALLYGAIGLLLFGVEFVPAP